MRATQLVARRLHAQRISSTELSRPEDVVAWLGAVQAQDYRGALWAVGLRLDGAVERDVEDALARRAIVRTWPMRGTLHFVAARDARWITELLAPRAAAAATSRLRSLGLNDAVLARARRAVVASLEGGRRLARSALYGVLDGAGIATTGQRGIHVLGRLAHDRVICFGPRDGKQQTFVLFDEWLPGATGLPRDEALATLAQRYFISHGPATDADFAWWSGLTLTESRSAIALAGDRLARDVIAGRSYWHGHATPARPRSSGAYVLPAFDEYLVGYSDRSALFDAAVSRRRPAVSLLSPAVVVGGRVVGTWKRELARDEVHCTVEPFGALGASAERGVARAFERYGRFLGLPVRVTAARARRQRAAGGRPTGLPSGR